MRIIIVDDHAVIRRGLRQILLDEFPKAYIAEVSDAEAAVGKIMENGWHLVICDLSLPGRSGLEVAEYVKQNFPKLPVLILSIHPEEQYAIRALKSGASGYLCKDAATEELVIAVHKVLQGRKYISSAVSEKLADQLDTDLTKSPHELLSPREFEVFKQLASGQMLSEIGNRLSLSVTTVSTYRARILKKMNISSNAGIIRYALETKLI